METLMQPIDPLAGCLTGGIIIGGVILILAALIALGSRPRPAPTSWHHGPNYREVHNQSVNLLREMEAIRRTAKVEGWTREFTQDMLQSLMDDYQ